MLDSCKMIFILVYDLTAKKLYLFGFVCLKNFYPLKLVVLFSDTQGCCLKFLKPLSGFTYKMICILFIIFNNALSD